MEKLIVNSYDEFASHLGQVLGTSDWVEVSQERINLFADATLDHQWIHVDTERAKTESPYKSTIAHGYLTLSLLPHMWNQIIEVNNLKMMVNYGMDKMKFGQAVVTGSSVRLVTTLQSIANLRGVCKAEIKFKIEINFSAEQAHTTFIRCSPTIPMNFLLGRTWGSPPSIHRLSKALLSSTTNLTCSRCPTSLCIR